jgi:DNA-binding NarL/FixJ family response regulator
MPPPVGSGGEEVIMHEGRLPLSPRELSVAELVADGQTNKEIALALAIRPTTVKDHIAAACGKLGLSGRVQLAAWYVKECS